MPVSSTRTDVELLSLLKKGDHTAFTLLYDRYWNRLLSFAVQKAGDLAEAENIVQDIFVSLWRRRESLEIAGDLEHYLVVSVKYRVIRLLSRKVAEPLQNAESRLAEEILDDSTQEYLSFEELRKKLEMLIGALPEKSRLIYRMNKEEGMSYKAIAGELNITEKAVDAHLTRARKSLRDGLSSHLSSFLL